MSCDATDPLRTVQPQMLRAGSPPDPQKLGEAYRREIGQAFEWALDRARLTKGEAAYRMGYADQGVIGRWVSGTERVQLDKCRLLGPTFYQEFVIALAQTCEGVEVRTQITLLKAASA